MLSSSEPAHIECIRCRPRRHAVRCSSASGSSARPQFHGNVADGSPNLDLLLVAAHHPVAGLAVEGLGERSEEHTSELQSLMRISYAVFCLKKNKTTNYHVQNKDIHHRKQ